ncbi:MAG: hypothetical protein JWR67_231 [Mucilaginibacter sp.]|nr:hypothetical protein [Mucilaginibacter sp.]
MNTIARVVNSYGVSFNKFIPVFNSKLLKTISSIISIKKIERAYDKHLIDLKEQVNKLRITYNKNRKTYLFLLKQFNDNTGKQQKDIHFIGFKY